MDNIIYTTPEKQIEKLKAQGLIIHDERSASKSLSMFGYSNLVKKYREPYFIVNNETGSYKSGTTFEQLQSLYLLDKNLRNGVMAAMLDLEEHLKELTADVIASSFGIHQDEYLNHNNYQNRRKRTPRFTLTEVLNTLKDGLNSGKDPIRHYRECHNIIPPWILFSGVYFGTLVNFIDKFKNKEKSELALRLIKTVPEKQSNSNIRSIMMDVLNICREYRNVAAHGGKIYNHICKSTLRIDLYSPGSPAPCIDSITQFLKILFFLNYDYPYKYIKALLEKELTRHCKTFPDDLVYFERVLNVNLNKTQAE